MQEKIRPPVENQILAALPKKKYGQLLSNLELVSLSLNQVLHQSGQTIRYVYFPNGGMVSLLASRDGNSKSVEVGFSGNEGVVGLSAFLGDEVAQHRAIVQLEGSAMRIPVEIFKQAANRPGPLQDMLHRCAQTLLIQVSRATFCNCFHKVDARLARWLLITQDYARSDRFPMTHEFISHMLGARRSGVTISAVALKNEALIRYTRGTITILDRQRLEAASCDCYQFIKAARARLFGA
jgi:CRP-like cAMP-binding protein